MALGALDLVLLVLSMLSSVAIGVYHGIKGRKSTPLEYLLGGRSMRPTALALSMMVGTVSALTIMGNAGEMYAYGIEMWFMDFGIFFGLVFIAKVFIPILYPLKMVSLFQYVEDRFKSKRLRQATVLLQLVGGYMFIGFLLYPPSIALKTFIGLSIPANIIIMGVTCTLYSTFGGVKAVVYTDVLQSIVMVVGVVAIGWQGSVTQGGIHRILDIAYHKGRLDVSMSLDPYQRYSGWLCITLGVFFAMGTYGVNQSQTQRCFSTGSVRQAKHVLYFAAFGMVIIRGLINYSGLVMFAHYQNCDPLTATKEPLDSAFIAVLYVTQELTKIPGLAGMFVAAIAAAVLSSVSTQLNSMTALLWEDFLKNLPFFSAWSDVRIGSLQKIIVFCTGVLGVVLGYAVSQMGRSFLRTVLAMNGALSGPLIGLFLLALYVPWVNYKGASCGFIVSIIFNVILAAGQVTMPKAPYLPLTRDACPDHTITTNTTAIITTNTTNITTLYTTTPITTILPSTTTITTPTTPITTILPSTTTITTSTTTTTNATTTTTTTPPGAWLFGLSDCLNSLWGTMLCMLVAIIVTVFTGSNTPEDVDERLIAPRAWEWFQGARSRKVIDYIQTNIVREKPQPTASGNNSLPPDTSDNDNEMTQIRLA